MEKWYLFRNIIVKIILEKGGGERKGRKIYLAPPFPKEKILVQALLNTS